MRAFTHILIAAGVSAGVFVALAALTPARSSPLVSADKPHNSEAADLAAPRIFADGMVEGADAEISLHFEVPGRIKAVHVHEGATVKAGDVLAELESDVAELQLTEAQARLRIAQAERGALVGTSDGRYPVTVSAAQRTVADEQVALGELAVRRESLFLDKLRLKAPIAGTVLRAHAQRGDFTGPTDDRELFVIIDRSRTRVRAFAEEFDGSRVVPGQLALVSLAAAPGKTYRGQVRTCAPCFRPKAQYRLKPGERLDVRVREIIIDLDKADDLLIGLPVEVFIEPGAARVGDLH